VPENLAGKCQLWLFAAKAAQNWSKAAAQKASALKNTLELAFAQRLALVRV
jgi:hypothetical protein